MAGSIFRARLDPAPLPHTSNSTQSSTERTKKRGTRILGGSYTVFEPELHVQLGIVGPPSRPVCGVHGALGHPRSDARISDLVGWSLWRRFRTVGSTVHYIAGLSA